MCYKFSCLHARVTGKSFTRCGQACTALNLAQSIPRGTTVVIMKNLPHERFFLSGQSSSLLLLLIFARN